MEEFDDLIKEPDESGALDLSHRAWARLDEAIWSWGSSLIVLNVCYNNITELSPKIKQLNLLRELDISSNQIEELPVEIAKLNRLKKLRVNGNRLRELPECIGELLLLEELSASENHIMKLPDSIGRLSVLQILKMQNNKLVNISPDLGDCLSLEEIDFSNNKQIENVPQQVLTDTDLILWMCRHNKQHRSEIEVLEETNEHLEDATCLDEEKKAKMKAEIQVLKDEKKRLLRERPEIYLKIQAEVAKYASVICSVS